MKLALLSFLISLSIYGVTAPTASSDFVQGYPTQERATELRNDDLFQTAVTAYKLWYPTVSFEGSFFGMREQGLQDNMGNVMKGSPDGMFFTANADTPYLGASLNLIVEPYVIEIPEGKYIGVVNDHHQRWIVDLGIPGKESGKPGKHVILPPGYKGQIPPGFEVSQSKSNMVMVAIRAIPFAGDANAALESLWNVKIYPLSSIKNPKLINLANMSDKKFDYTLLRWEDNFQYWTHLKKVIDEEPLVDDMKPMYGLLGKLGIEKGKPFKPDANIKSILEKAAKEGRDQMLVAGFADQRPDRIVWKDRKWEWAALVYDNGDFKTNAGFDLQAKDKWFSQAQGTSPAMFRRAEGGGSLYWLGLRDKKGMYLDGSKTYKLTIPGPIPSKLFWSVSIYDSGTRCFVQTDQNRAAIRSMFELNDMNTKSYELFFGPQAPIGRENQWVKTIPGKGWFSYFRIYGPTKDAFKGKWKPGDFEEVDMEKLKQAQEEK